MDHFMLINSSTLNESMFFIKENWSELGKKLKKSLLAGAWTQCL